MPRSASLNLTVDMFGQSVNLLEFGGRAQGLESIIERYFGPGSEFQDAMAREKRAVVRDDVINNIDRRVMTFRILLIDNDLLNSIDRRVMIFTCNGRVVTEF